MNDKRVRLAAALAIDKQKLVDTLFAGSATVASQPFPSFMIGYNPDLKPYPYDPEKAKQLIAEAKAAGVPVGQELQIPVRQGHFPRAEENAEAVAHMLQEVGLKSKVS